MLIVVLAFLFWLALRGELAIYARFATQRATQHASQAGAPGIVSGGDNPSTSGSMGSSDGSGAAPFYFSPGAASGADSADSAGQPPVMPVVPGSPDSVNVGSYTIHQAPTKTITQLPFSMPSWLQWLPGFGSNGQ